MPDYDFNCHDCKTEFNLHYKSFLEYAAVEKHVCSRCKSSNTARKIGRVAITKGQTSRLDSLANSTIDENNPKETENFIKKLGQELDAGTD